MTFTVLQMIILACAFIIVCMLSISIWKKHRHEQFANEFSNVTEHPECPTIYKLDYDDNKRPFCAMCGKAGMYSKEKKQCYSCPAGMNAQNVVGTNCQICPDSYVLDKSGKCQAVVPDEIEDQVQNSLGNPQKHKQTMQVKQDWLKAHNKPLAFTTQPGQQVDMTKCSCPAGFPILLKDGTPSCMATCPKEWPVHTVDKCAKTAPRVNPIKNKCTDPGAEIYGGTCVIKSNIDMNFKPICKLNDDKVVDMILIPPDWYKTPPGIAP